MNKFSNKEKEKYKMQDELSRMRNIDIRMVDKTALKDIKDVVIDTSLPVQERVKSYISQIKNPYCYMSHGVVVKIGLKGERRLEECIRSCMNL